MFCVAVEVLLSFSAPKARSSTYAALAEAMNDAQHPINEFRCHPHIGREVGIQHSDLVCRRRGSVLLLHGRKEPNEPPLCTCTIFHVAEPHLRCYLFNLGGPIAQCGQKLRMHRHTGKMTLGR